MANLITAQNHAGGSPYRGLPQGRALLSEPRRGEILYVEPTEGRGGAAYIAEPYAYRGQGASLQAVSFDQVGRYNWLVTSCCAAICALACLIPTIYFVCAALQPAPLFDCEVGYENWQRGWSQEKQQYCCQATGMACPLSPSPGSDLLPQAAAAAEQQEAVDALPGLRATTTSVTTTTTTITTTTLTTTTVTTTPMFQCYEGFDNWEHGWTRSKKHWCCKHAGMGCQKWEEYLQDWLVIAAVVGTFVIGFTLACCFCCCYQLCCSKRGGRPKMQHEEDKIKEITERLDMHRAGSGEITVSLMWDTTEDLDLHLELPSGNFINHQSKQRDGGELDIDANVSRSIQTDRPVENIFWPRGSRPPRGQYTIYVAQNNIRHPVCFSVKLTVAGHTEVYNNVITQMHRQKLCVATFDYPLRWW